MRIRLKRTMVWGAFWLSAFVVVIAVIRWEPIPEGIPSVLTGLFGFALTVYGGAQAATRIAQRREEEPWHDEMDRDV